MLFHILYPLAGTLAVLNVVKYLAFRSISAVITALLASFILGPYVIRKMRTLRIYEVIHSDGPDRDQEKLNIPIMGGLILIPAILISTLLWADLTNYYVLAAIFITLSHGLIGFTDDYKKISERLAASGSGSSRQAGLSGRQKLFWQTATALAVVLSLYLTPGLSTAIYFPFFKNLHPDLHLFFIPFAVLVIVGTSNAVNLTDGQDGLAIGPVSINAATYMLFAYLAGHSALAAYLQIPAVPGAGELSVFCAAIVGAGLGFLWYSSHPAEIFMGDTGSLALGGAIGTVAVITKQEILLLIVGGLFVVEALSVILQVGSFRIRGKRIFKMAPIHHHF